uniref:Uncharacterized protein n=1 Tax=Arcella intermedia TaxID=1963864 RepID=A0A6B2LJ96_9EUKA
MIRRQDGPSKLFFQGCNLNRRGRHNESVPRMGCCFLDSIQILCHQHRRQYLRRIRIGQGIVKILHTLLKTLHYRLPGLRNTLTCQLPRPRVRLCSKNLRDLVRFRPALLRPLLLLRSNNIIHSLLHINIRININHKHIHNNIAMLIHPPIQQPQQIMGHLILCSKHLIHSIIHPVESEVFFY